MDPCRRYWSSRIHFASPRREHRQRHILACPSRVSRVECTDTLCARNSTVRAVARHTCLPCNRRPMGSADCHRASRASSRSVCGVRSTANRAGKRSFHIERRSKWPRVFRGRRPRPLGRHIVHLSTPHECNTLRRYPASHSAPMAVDRNTQGRPGHCVGQSQPSPSTK